MAEPRLRGRGEHAHLSVGGADGTIATPRAAVCDPPIYFLADGEPTRLSGGSAGSSRVIQSIAISNPSPQAGGDSTCRSEKGVGGAGTVEGAAISVPPSEPSPSPPVCPCVLAPSGPPAIVWPRRAVLGGPRLATRVPAEEPPFVASPRDWSAREIGKVVHRLLKYGLELRERVHRVLLKGCEVGLRHGPPALPVVARHCPLRVEIPENHFFV